MKKSGDATSQSRTGRPLLTISLTQWIVFIGLPFAAILICFLANRFPRFPGDLEISLWLQSFQSPLLEVAAMGISLAGRNLPSLAMIVASAVGLWLAGKRLEARFVFFLIVPNLFNKLLKVLIGRPRPTEELLRVLDHVSELSFPSGHVMHYLLLFGFLLYMTLMLVENAFLRTTLVIFFGLVIIAVGPSRVYVGAHWPSDVLGGYLIGGLFLSLMICSYNKKAQQSYGNRRLC